MESSESWHEADPEAEEEVPEEDVRESSSEEVEDVAVSEPDLGDEEGLEEYGTLTWCGGWSN